jgi:hypothetical protein
MPKQIKQQPLTQVLKTEELKDEDEKEMKQASLMNPQSPCGKVEDQLGK